MTAWGAPHFQLYYLFRRKPNKTIFVFSVSMFERTIRARLNSLVFKALASYPHRLPRFPVPDLQQVLALLRSP